MPAVRGSSLVISKGLAATANFHPQTVWIRTSELTRARYRLEVRGDTGTVQVAVGYQTADDVDSPAAAAQLGTMAYLGADGVQYGDDWVDLTTILKTASWIRFGSLVKQDADGSLQAATTLLRVDYKLQ
ncbi:MAG: hypothetical protein FJ102_03105 [Deltaproteobacteria bacterium]|nr:hypothetical protein [Deltaproteobacteria bacterium]